MAPASTIIPANRQSHHCTRVVLFHFVDYCTILVEDQEVAESMAESIAGSIIIVIAGSIIIVMAGSMIITIAEALSLPWLKHSNYHGREHCHYMEHYHYIEHGNG